MRFRSGSNPLQISWLVLPLVLAWPTGLQGQGIAPDTTSMVVSWGEGVRVGAWIQPIFVLEGRDWTEDAQGFSLRRARLDVTGALIQGKVHFRLMPDLTQNPELRDAWVELRGQGARLRMGQQTVPFHLQRDWSMAYAHFGDRALAARIFELSGGRDVGVTGAVEGMDGRLRIEAGVFNGEGANRRGIGRKPHMAGRATLALGGESPERESGRARPQDPVLSLGLGGMMANRSSLRPRPGFSAGREVDWKGGTVDAHLSWRGATLLTGVFLQRTTLEGGTSETGDGLYLSAGWAPADLPIEGAIRFSEAIWDRDRDPARDNELSVGLTYFHVGHASQFRIQFARERRFGGYEGTRSLHRLTLEHQLLLGG